MAGEDVTNIENYLKHLGNEKYLKLFKSEVKSSTSLNVNRIDEDDDSNEALASSTLSYDFKLKYQEIQSRNSDNSMKRNAYYKQWQSKIKEKEKEYIEINLLMQQELQNNKRLFNENIENLKKNKESLAEMLKKKRNVLQEISTREKENTKQRKTICDKEKEVYMKEKVDLVRLKATFALLLSTFSIKWKYNCDSNDLDGCIFNKKSVQPFHFDLKTHNQKYVSDHLWEMLEQSSND